MVCCSTTLEFSYNFGFNILPNGFNQKKLPLADYAENHFDPDNKF